jgi:hypothetical protein
MKILIIGRNYKLCHPAVKIMQAYVPNSEMRTISPLYPRLKTEILVNVPEFL